MGLNENQQSDYKMIDKQKNNFFPFAVTRIWTWVVAATTLSTNHYTITAVKKLISKYCFSKR